MRRMIDLTLPMHEGMLTVPRDWHARMEVTILGRHEMEGRYTCRVSFGTHTGTHMDSPLHFIKGAQSIDEVPLETVIGRAKVIDMSHKGALGVIDMEDLERCGVSIGEGDRLIFRTDWYDRWMTPDFFKKHPCFSEAACHWMVDHGVKLVAIDVPSVDDATVGAVLGEVQPCHYILMEGGVIIIENITNLREIAKPEVELIALPLPLKGLEACPIRMVAIEEG